jgi:hypothetical protein
VPAIIVNSATVNTASMTCFVSRRPVSAAQVASLTNESTSSSSAARSSADSKGDQPIASGPRAMRVRSSVVSPARRAAAACCAHTYSDRLSQAVRRMSSSR